MVDANARYAAAAGEISARIQSRNNIALQFVTYAATVIGIATSKPEWNIIGATVGYIALGIVFLVRSHTLFIATLVRFQRGLTAGSEGSLPDWNSIQQLRNTTAARRSADHSQMFFLLTSVVMGGIVSLPPLNPLKWNVAFWVVGVSCGVLALGVFYQTGIKRDEILLSDE